MKKEEEVEGNQEREGERQCKTKERNEKWSEIKRKRKGKTCHYRIEGHWEKKHK